jgi:hypothetical protein
MLDEHNLVSFSRSEGDAYKSSQAAEPSLNAAILRAEIARSYEEFLDIVETFYADDVEVSGEDLPGMMRGKAKVRPFLLNILMPLHVMAEGAGCRCQFSRPRFLKTRSTRRTPHGGSTSPASEANAVL